MQANEQDKLFDTLKSKNKGAISNRDIKKAMELLSPEQEEKLHGLMNDPSALQDFLSSASAQKLINMLNKNE